MKPSAQIPDNIAPLLNKIVEGFESVLRSDLTSIDSHLSLAMGCFNRTQSDVDLPVRMRGEQRRDAIFSPIIDQVFQSIPPKNDTEAWNRALLETCDQFIITEVKGAW